MERTRSGRPSRNTFHSHRDHRLPLGGGTNGRILCVCWRNCIGYYDASYDRKSNGRDTEPHPGLSERGFACIGSALLPDHTAGYPARWCQRNHDRGAHKHSKSCGRDSATSVHCLWKRFYELELNQPRSLPPSSYLQLRYESLSRMASSRLGSFLCACGFCVNPEFGNEDSNKKMESAILKTEDLRAYYEDNQVVKNINLSIPEFKITVIMGPSGCGKSTLVRCFNRMHEMVPGARIEGKVFLKEENVYDMEPITVRTRIGMVFQRPNPFPMMTIRDNVIAGYILNGIKLNRSKSDDIVEQSLKEAALWDEVKDYLHKKGTFLSGGQQQRLCIARALAVKPDVLLFDEPTSALDPKATSHIEGLMADLKNTVTIILVTHNIAQAGRVSDFIAFLYLGELVEFGPKGRLLTTPKDKRTEEFLTGKFG